MRETAPCEDRYSLRVGPFEYEARLEFDGTRFFVYRRRRKAGYPWRKEHERTFLLGEEFSARRYYASLRQELASELGHAP